LSPGPSLFPGPPLSRTIAGELSAAAAGYPDGVAICDEAEHRTFGELRRDVWQAAEGLLAGGLRPGDRVALWAPNTLDAAIALLAVAVAGGVVVPLNTRYRRHEMAEILRRAQCRMVIAPGSFLGRPFAAEALEVAGGASVVSLGGHDPAGARPWPEIVAGGTETSGQELAARIATQSGADAAVVQYTSGTTGQPKGAVLRQGPMLATAATWAEVVGMRHGDVYPVTYPLAHVGGFKTGVLTTLAARATCVLFPVVNTETLVAVISAHQPTIVNGPPPVLRSLLSAVRDGLLPASTRIRIVVTGSAIVPPPLVRDLARVLGVADVIIAYGLTEATGVCTMTRRGDPLELVCETVGTVIEGVQVRIAPAPATGGDEFPAEFPAGAPEGADRPAGTGEIEVRGPNVMVGYLDDPGATAEVMDDGWLRTGDVGWIGDDGYVRIVGRTKDMVVVGGFNVYPAEVEHVLADHPGVSEAAVVGVPDDRLGEVVVAFVVPSAATTATTTTTTTTTTAPATLLQWCRDRLANFKVPRHVWIVESLPRGAVGKIAKSDLRARALASLGAPGIPATGSLPSQA
jgi:acyl-CoA synthetase (AMP-forming)/AMP-acid ligase II